MVEAERADASRTATQQPSSSQPETPSSTVKAPVDLFKAVFQDSGSDSDTSDGSLTVNNCNSGAICKRISEHDVGSGVLYHEKITLIYKKILCHLKH